MRHIGIAAKAAGLAVAMGCVIGTAAPAQAQDDLHQIPQTAQSLPQTAGPGTSTALAEAAFHAALGESRASVIGAEATAFADRVAQSHLGGAEGESWREEVARIHDPVRVSALLLVAIESQLDAANAVDPDLLAALGATGVDMLPDGQGLMMAARLELARPGALDAMAVRLRADAARDAPILDAIDHMIAMQDPVTPAMAAQMNRMLAFMRAFSDGGGYEFPTSPDDAAADLMLQLPEIRQEATMRIRLAWYAAYAPLGAGAVNRSAARRANPEARALESLLDRAEGNVIEQLAAETGRAAARRMKGTPL